ncbi:MAG TPA: O-antigen ligase family protein [Stellaceae bacterium]|nr:O-antigen ligase family protein [Stellaceae bacterium]
MSRPGEATERLIFWLFVAGLAWVPYWYGSNDLIAWGINSIGFPGLAASYEISLLIRGRNHPVAIGDLALPTGLFFATLLWIWFQTIAWTHLPLADPIWRMASQALGTPLDGRITVSPDLTNLAAMRLATAASVFWIALQLCRDDHRAVLLLKAVASIACAYAGFGIIASRFPAIALPALDLHPSKALASSTFINRNTFATYAGLGLVAVSGLLLRHYRHEVAGGDAGWRLQLATVIEATGSKAALPLAGAFILLVALLLTGSRGGVIATGAGLLLLAFLSRPRGTGAARALSIIGPVIVLITATLFAFGGLFVDSIEQRGISDSERLSVYLLTMRSILDSPLLGHGYGAFADVFPLYRDRSLSVQGVWSEAHNTYLEVFQGLGLMFGLMLVASVILLVLSCLKGAIRRREHVTAPRVAASVAVLVGVHAMVDFSLQIQAVALTFMALLGAGRAQADSPRTPAGQRP